MEGEDMGTQARGKALNGKNNHVTNFSREKINHLYFYVKTDEIPLFFVPKLFPMFFVTKMREIFVNLSHFSWRE